MAGPSDLNERVCKHKVESKKIYIEIVSFPTDVLPSLIIVKEPEGVSQLFLEIYQNSQENTCARVSFLIKLQAASKEHLRYYTMIIISPAKFY